jgi:hypothetical protein
VMVGAAAASLGISALPASAAAAPAQQPGRTWAQWCYNIGQGAAAGCVTGTVIGATGGGIAGTAGGPPGAVAGAGVGAVGGAIVGAVGGAIGGALSPYDYK